MWNSKTLDASFMQDFLENMNSALNMISKMCIVRSHDGFKKYQSECSHPDCIIRTVLEE